MHAFERRVRKIVARIPRGSVLTYKEVAKRAGNERACRAVGNILGRNIDPAVPCHRVIRSDGTTGGYRDGEARKRERLKEEGYLR